LGRDEAGDKVFIVAQRFAGRMIKWNANDFVTGAALTVP
jgi:hypothetical protein